jgi:hypothetical protein
MGTGMILLIVFGCLFGGCMILGAISSGKKNGAGSKTAQADPSAAQAAADRLAATQKAAAEAKEKNATDTFPTKSVEIASTLKRATTEADQAKWALADTDLTAANTALEDFRGTSVAESKDFQQLDAKLATQKKRVDPQVQKLAKAAANAAAEKELKASTTAVSSYELFNAYQANEVAADDRYKGKKLLVTGSVASIDKGLSAPVLGAPTFTKITEHQPPC